MTISAFGIRRLLALSALGPAAALAAACGTSSSNGSPATSVTVTVTPSSGGGAPASTQSTPPGGPTSAGPAECTTATLHVKIGPGNGAAGTIYYDIVFTNAGSGTCFLRGYPGVSLVSAGSNSGSQIGADAKRDAVTPSRQIILAPGKAAYAPFTTQTCASTSEPTMRITAISSGA